MDVEKFVEDELKKLQNAEFEALAETIEEPEVRAKYEKHFLKALNGCGTTTWIWTAPGQYWFISANNCTGDAEPVYPTFNGSVSWQTTTTDCDCGEEEGGGYYYYDDEDDCTDCTGQACTDYPKLDSTANYQVFSDGPQTSNHTTVEATKVTQRILCATPSVDFPACASHQNGKFICHNAMQLRGTLNIPPNCIIDHAHLRILASEEQQGLQTGDGTASIAASIENPNQFQTLIQLAQLENHCLWRDVPEFTSGNYYNTSNIGPAIQDIVNLDDWETGDDFSLILSPKFFATDGGRYFHTTVLHVYWHNEFDEEGNGGTVAGGVSEVFVVTNETSEGGVVVNGESYLAPILEVEMSGGIVVGGEADLPDPEDIIELEMAGGVVVNGSAWVGGTIIPTGGVVVGQGTYPNGYKYRLPFVVTPGAIKHDLDRFYPIIVANVHSHLVETGTDFHVEDEMGNTVLHSIRSYHDGKLVFSIKTPLTTSGKNFHLYYGRN